MSIAPRECFGSLMTPRLISLIVGCEQSQDFAISDCVRSAELRSAMSCGQFISDDYRSADSFVNRNYDAVSYKNPYMEPKTFGARLRSARTAAKMTQKTLAKRSGISQPTLSEMETGGIASSGSTATFAAILGVKALWLETGKGQRSADEVCHQGQEAPDNALSNDAAELLTAFDRMTDTQRAELLRSANDVAMGNNEVLRAYLSRTYNRRRTVDGKPPIGEKERRAMATETDHFAGKPPADGEE